MVVDRSEHVVEPLGRRALLVAVESFLGALLMATLVFVLGRRSTR